MLATHKKKTFRSYLKKNPAQQLGAKKLTFLKVHPLVDYLYDEYCAQVCSSVSCACNQGHEKDQPRPKLTFYNENIYKCLAHEKTIDL